MGRAELTPARSHRAHRLVGRREDRMTRDVRRGPSVSAMWSPPRKSRCAVRPASSRCARRAMGSRSMDPWIWRGWGSTWQRADSRRSAANAPKQMRKQMSFNLEHLQRQRQMQQRIVHAAIGNIMKTKQDTVKNSVSTCVLGIRVEWLDRRPKDLDRHVSTRGDRARVDRADRSPRSARSAVGDVQRRHRRRMSRPVPDEHLNGLTCRERCTGRIGGRPYSACMNWPDGFMWGTGASSTQCEGAAPASDWWDWERAGRAPLSGDGNGFATRYAEDFALLAGLGLTHHRLSIEWARIEPEPGEHDATAVAHYRDVLTAARDAGVAPWVSLHHFTLPRWFAADGGFLDRRQPHRRLGAARRLRRRDVRRPRRRLAAGQRDQLLRPRCVRRRRLAARATTIPRRRRSGRRDDPARERRGGRAAPADRRAGLVDLRALRVRRSGRRNLRAPSLVDYLVQHVVGARASACSATACCGCRAATRSSVPTSPARST